MFRLFLEFSGELFHRNVNGISVEFAVPNQMMLRFLRISRVFQRNERYWRSSQGLEAACDFPVCKRCFIKLCVRKQRLLIGDGFFFVEFLRGGGGIVGNIGRLGEWRKRIRCVGISVELRCSNHRLFTLHSVRQSEVKSTREVNASVETFRRTSRLSFNIICSLIDNAY